MLRDLDSRNGLFLNGRPIKQAPLKMRDVLRIGDWIGVLVPLPADGSTTWTFEELSKGYWAGPALLAALAPARLAAGTDLSVIIQGATGVGKEGAAQAIHTWSRRAGPFVPVNCATLETLAEAQLFGYRKGAFTGADHASPGFLRAAQGGTLFLDEIADLPMLVQAKLLRAVEQREVVPLGESKAISIDVRLLTATQGPLSEAVKDERFRKDLLGRLEGLTVRILPLRERAEEVPFLFAKFLERGRGQTASPRLDPLLIERLCAYDWPFNVRGLAQLARRLAALHASASVLDLASLSQDLPPEESVRASSPTNGLPLVTDDGGPSTDPSPQVFVASLRENRGNVRQTAVALGISRGRAYRLMDKMGSVDLDIIRQPASQDPISDE
jgi:two-component system response regulator FlrC